jgi:hypothetical protein
MKIRYVVNDSTNTKSRAGQGIDHKAVMKCFSKEVRGHEMKKGITNIMNDDNLCLLYYIVSTKFFSFLEYDKENPHRFERKYTLDIDDYYDSRRRKWYRGFDENRSYFYLMLTLIKYPNDQLNDQAKKILDKYYPGCPSDEYLTAEIILKTPYQSYYFECKELAKKLNESSMFPLSYKS